MAERTKELEFNNGELSKYIGLIERISITDELTGLYNRRYFNKLFLDEVDKAAAGKRYLTYLMLDIDYFKNSMIPTDIMKAIRYCAESAGY